MNRRGFLGAMLAAAAAPAIVRAGSLMPVYVPRPQILTLWGDGIHDDTATLQAMLAGALARHGTVLLAPQEGSIYLPQGVYKLSDTLVLDKSTKALHVSGSKFVADAGMSAEKSMIYCGDGAEGRIENCHFNRGITYRAPKP